MTTRPRIFVAFATALLLAGGASMHGLRARGVPPPLSPVGAAVTGAHTAAVSQSMTVADDVSARCRQMATDARVAGARADDLAAATDAATGDAKIERIADLLVASVEERRGTPMSAVVSGVRPARDADHHMTVPSRAQGAGLVSGGQMAHLMESMDSAMQPASAAWMNGCLPMRADAGGGR